jgi:hypothetical protein
MPHSSSSSSSSSSAQVQAAVLGKATATEAGLSLTADLTAATAAAANGATADDTFDVSNTTPQRKLFQAAAAAGGVCNKGTPTSSSTMNAPTGSPR